MADEPEPRPWLPHVVFLVMFAALCGVIALLARRWGDDDGGRGEDPPPRPRVPPSAEVRGEAFKRRMAEARAKKRAEREAAKKPEPQPAPPAGGEA